MCRRRQVEAPHPHLPPPVPTPSADASAPPDAQDATGPVHAVLSENTAVYHFWGSEAHRWQVASVELFDASPSTLR